LRAGENTAISRRSLVLLLLLFLGVLYGASLVRQGESRFAVFRLIDWKELLVMPEITGFSAVFRQIFWCGFGFWLCFSLTGLLVGGQGASGFLLFCCGLSFGARLGYAYRLMRHSGLLLTQWYLLFCMPLVMLILFWSAREAVILQQALWQVLCGKQPKLRDRAVMRYGSKQLLLLLVLILVAATGGWFITRIS